MSDTGPRSNVSWSRGKALDHRALGHGLGVRHWTTERWVMVQCQTLVRGAMDHGLGVRHWTAQRWVMGSTPAWVWSVCHRVSFKWLQGSSKYHHFHLSDLFNAYCFTVYAKWALKGAPLNNHRIKFILSMCISPLNNHRMKFIWFMCIYKWYMNVIHYEPLRWYFQDLPVQVVNCLFSYHVTWHSWELTHPTVLSCTVVCI